MSVKRILEYYDLFDHSILSHGFTGYFRDYQIKAQIGDGPSGIQHFLFRGCVEVDYRLTLPTALFSVDDTFINYDHWQASGSPAGFVWDTGAVVYPGWQYIHESQRAAAWARKLQITMHEIFIETNIFALGLIFHDLVVT